MLEQLRAAALKKAQEPRDKPLIAHPILLSGAGDGAVVWDISKEEQTLLLTTPDSITAPVFENIAAHVAKHNNLVEYVAIDLKGRMFESMDEAKTERTAVTVDEAWSLSTHLLEELRQRVSKKTWEQELLVLIKDGETLFTIDDPDKANLYYELLTNLQAVIVAGAMFGIKVLMEVDADTVTEASSKDFANKISI